MRSLRELSHPGVTRLLRVTVVVSAGGGVWTHNWYVPSRAVDPCAKGEDWSRKWADRQGFRPDEVTIIDAHTTELSPN